MQNFPAREFNRASKKINHMNKRILISLSVIGAVAAIAVGGTIAYFSSTQTSTGNTFTAGTLDLKVDSTCHYDGMVCATGGAKGGTYWQLENPGAPSSYPELLGQACSCTWLEKDLTTGDLFFNYIDVKPGDIGENTISLDVVSNPAWVCAKIDGLKTTAGIANEPKCIAQSGTWANNACNIPMKPELQSALKFTVWIDKTCDNIYNSNDDTYVVQGQPASAINWAIADSQHGGQPLAGGSNTCIGVEWSIDGASVGNEIQGDNLTGNVTFTATQSRNNASFTCNPSQPGVGS